MDTRLLRHYESELAYLREMGANFAETYPKIAARLGMDGLEVLDPYVERLLEGSAFLSARVQLELELQYPQFTSHLLELVYPHYLAPTPSMMVAQLHPDLDNTVLTDGYVVERGTALRSSSPDGSTVPCIFRTGMDLTLWPVEISEAEYIESRADVLAAQVDCNTEARAAIRLRIRRPDGNPLNELSLDALTFFVGGQGAPGWKLLELLCTETLGLVARSTDRRADWVEPLKGELRHRGFSPREALLPTPRRSFDGYRLLQEYFAMPERFFFVEATGLSRAILQTADAQVDLYILLRDGMPEIAPTVRPEAFKLNCVPAVNLFHKRCDRVHVVNQDFEQHIVVDRTAPLDYEVYSLESVTAIGTEGELDVPFQPFYSVDDLTPLGEGGRCFYTIRRKMRQRTERERLRGGRTNYLGSETFVSLVDGDNAPYKSEVSQLAVRAMVTNRDLPMLLTTGAPDVFHLPDGGPVGMVTTPVSPTRPRPSFAHGDAAWRLISHLGLNYLSIADSEGGTAAATIRELIGLYVPEGDRGMRRQLEGLTRVSSSPKVRRMTDEVLSTAVRGLEVKLEFDESFFEGGSVYLLGAVLEHFFRGHATINSFTETALFSQQRGELKRWRPQTGHGRII
ncbi:type VI secretion system baseplate subunit TssF [Aliiruegeria lutimaris]|uniref:Type VI secretion system protein ImpG n=1 Tax=Aliiruegeria lutimaris TaxID=571298 RepID=A0A1G8K5P4_9RHOB|nr:type VI secretion system baseplate subunit TssF [Aliiruegeria lutimaris]SDI38741.1 type VI secretion system protein ImpG [Aliiruegeria lutimaris]